MSSLPWRRPLNRCKVLSAPVTRSTPQPLTSGPPRLRPRTVHGPERRPVRCQTGPTGGTRYLLEITVLGVGGLVSVSANRTSSPPLWGNVTWAIGGVFLSLAVLGAWSIGPSVVPALLALVAAAILAGVRRRQKVFTQVGWFAGGVMGQAVIMVLAIFLLNRVH